MSGSYIDGEDLDRYTPKPISTKEAIIIDREQYNALRAENERLASKLHDALSQLEIATDLGEKRWVALNEIYEYGEKHNANWCKRKAQEGLGIKNG